MVETVRAYCVAKEFDPATLKALLQKRGDSDAERFKGVWASRYDGKSYYVFDYGVVILWGGDDQLLHVILDALAGALISPLLKPETDYFTFSFDEPFRVREDHISLGPDDEMMKLAVSHGLAQSCKLQSFETAMKDLMNNSQDIPSQLAAYGTIRMSQKKISRQRGGLFQAKTEILLRFDLLDIPEFFWEYPEYDQHYQAIIRYLELAQRLTLIQHKFDTLDHILAMLADEQKHKHSSLLEWIIIVLISIEIVIFFGHDLLHWF